VALDGVGALADRLSPAQEYTIRGRTAPWAELVVVDPDDSEQADRIWVLAELEPTGTFEFTFRISPTLYPRLQIFAIDELGTTNRVLLPVPSNQEILLPPTIVNDLDDTSSDRAALTGFTHPNAEITLTITDRDTDESFSVSFFAEANGRWRYLSEALPGGRYVATAISQSGALTSQASQEIFFELPREPLPPPAFDLIGLLPEPIRRLLETLVEQAPLISQLLVPFAFASSGFLLTDLIASLLKLLLGFLHLLGFRRNRRNWGVVYNAVTKQPLERAIVRLYDAVSRSLVETDVTGGDGVFSFLPKQGKYSLKVTRSQFVFPSRLVRGSGNDGEYENLYHGETLELKENQVVAVSIPMDPAEARSSLVFKLKQLARRLGNQLNWGILLVGMSFATFTLSGHFSFLNLAVFIIYLILLIHSLMVYRKRETSFGVVRDRASNELVEGVGISLYDTEFNRMVQRRVSDEQGRFQLLVPPGKYRLEVVSLEWVLDVSGPRGFKGEFLYAPEGVKTTVLAPTVYVSRKTKA
jgi:hypothetical protein